MSDNHVAEPSKFVFRWPLCFLLAIFAVELILILIKNNGLLIYTLDDAYIHFSVAENLIHGHYGINSQELSAPCSSILWPFIVAPLTRLPFTEWAVLLVNMGAAVATLWVQFRIIKRIFVNKERNHDAGHDIFAYVLLLFLIPIANLVGLVFCGMEHSLQVLLANLVLAGLIAENEDGRIPVYLAAALVASPLIRYESLAITVPAVIYLFFRGYRRSSLAIALMVSGMLAIFSGFLYFNNLGLLPNSIVARSVFLNWLSPVSLIQRNLLKNLGNPFGWILLSVTLSWVPAIFAKECRSVRRLAVVFFSAGMLHLMAGDLWYYGRYETYILSVLVLGFFYIYRPKIRRFITGRVPAMRAAVFFVPLFILSLPSVLILLTIPMISNEVYRQPYQYHRFVTDFYAKPVAVNDLGWASYRNPNYVLDLWGVGSREALGCRLSGMNVKCWAALAREKNIGLVIITQSWFPRLPAGWIKIAEYDRGGILLNIMGGVFGKAGFFITDESYRQEVTAALLAFRETIPAPAHLTIYPRSVITRPGG
jgi:hypothetical protein